MYSKIKTVQCYKRQFMTEAAIATCLVPVILSPFLYKISESDQYLVRTGLGIKDISVSKKGFVLPIFHTASYITMHPHNYEFKLHAMSVEKIPFILPGFFTIGPKNDNESLVKYVRFLAGTDIAKIILGIIEGETRTLSSKMTMEEIFNDRQMFKNTIIKGVQEELDQFGLQVQNANIKELQDTEDSKYFFNMMQQKASSVENQAKIAVSEANKLGNVGYKEREATTRQHIALLEAETIKQENNSNKNIQVSNAELSVITSQADQTAKIAEIESSSNAAIREYELMLIVEQKRYDAELLKSKATLLPNAMIEAESIKINAEAVFFAKQKEADGLKAVYLAQSDGINQLLTSFKNDQQALMQYIMVENNLYEKIAEANAKGLQGLNPKITMFNASTDTSNNPLNDLIKMGMPVALSYLNNQMEIKNKE